MNSNLLSSNGSLSNNILKEECKKNHKREKITNKNFVLLRIAKINRRTDIRARNTQAKPSQVREMKYFVYWDIWEYILSILMKNIFKEKLSTERRR